jgi:hypothetical protein
MTIVRGEPKYVGESTSSLVIEGGQEALSETAPEDK